jgi:hypothetical protein
MQETQFHCNRSCMLCFCFCPKDYIFKGSTYKGSDICVGSIGMFIGRVFFSSMERTEGREEGEKSQEEELQWLLDH